MEHHTVVIVGGGNAGISLTARLLRDGAQDVAIVEPETVHRYRPLLNYVGAGQATMASLERPAAEVMPPGCTWIKDRVVAVDPETPSVWTQHGREIGCSTLVLCPGLEEDWDTTPGLADAYTAGWAGSTFTIDSAPHVWGTLRDLSSGRVVFTMPPEPAPCAATALKPLFMACDHWRRAGVLLDLDVRLVLPGRSPLGVPAADERLEHALTGYGVRVLRGARVTGLQERQIDLATVHGDAQLENIAYAHVVPHYRAPAGSPTTISATPRPPASSTSIRARCATAATPRSGRWVTSRPSTPAHPAVRSASRSPSWPTTSPPPTQDRSSATTATPSCRSPPSATGSCGNNHFRNLSGGADRSMTRCPQLTAMPAGSRTSAWWTERQVEAAVGGGSTRGTRCPCGRTPSARVAFRRGAGAAVNPPDHER